MQGSLKVLGFVMIGLAAVALVSLPALDVSLGGVILVVALFLLCPIVMWFGMRGTRRESGQSRKTGAHQEPGEGSFNTRPEGKNLNRRAREES